MKNKSKIFKPLTKEEIDKIFTKHFSCRAESFRQLHGGLFNATYLVCVKNMQYILQAGPINTDLLLPFERHLGEAEIYACNLLKENGIPTNKPVISDFSKQIIDRDYIIFSYIDSLNLSDKAVKSTNKAKFQKQVGVLTKGIHEITGSYFGRVSESFDGITFSKWSDFLLYELGTIVSACKKHNAFSEKVLNEITTLFEQGKLYFDYKDTPKLVHMDLWEGNILIDCNQELISAVIDADRCLFGDPDMDLASSWLITDDFLEGYGGLPNSEHRDTKILYYQLFYSLTDAYVWKVEYCNRLNYLKTYRRIKSLMKKIKSVK